MTEPDSAGRGERQSHDGYADVLATAIDALTKAARLTLMTIEPTPARSDNSTSGPTRVPEDRRAPVDWAEFVVRALAGAAANIGGIEEVLSGRPRSWEASGVRQLLISCVGYDGHDLLAHRTETVVVSLDVDEILVDLGLWTAYDDALRELERREEAVTASQGATPEERETQLDVLADLVERLEQLQIQDWTDYAQKLKTAAEAAAAQLDGLRVPVVVNLALGTCQLPADVGHDLSWSIAEQLRAAAIHRTPLPGDGRPPLARLEADHPADTDH